jgi:hypothetical protein
VFAEAITRDTTPSSNVEHAPSLVEHLAAMLYPYPSQVQPPRSFSRAKRYALYTKTKDDIGIVEPKAHGLGYFYPPKDSPGDGNMKPHSGY